MVGYRSPDDGDAVRVVGVVPWVPRTAQGSVGLSLKCHVTAGVYKITVLAAFGGADFIELIQKIFFHRVSFV